MEKVQRPWHVRITCPECYTTGRLNQLHLGCQVVCKSCKHSFLVEVKSLQPEKEIEELSGAILLSPVRNKRDPNVDMKDDKAIRCPECRCEAQFPEDYYHGQVRCPRCLHRFPDPT